MPTEYKTIEEVAGPLMLVRRVKGVTYNELGEIELENGETRRCRVLEVEGDKDDADLLIVGFGGTYGHLHAAMDELRAAGNKVALAHFKFINPLPKNTEEVMKRYKKVVVAEQNMGQFAGYLRMKVDGFVPYQFNQVKGQPFLVNELVQAFEEIIKN